MVAAILALALRRIERLASADVAVATLVAAILALALRKTIPRLASADVAFAAQVAANLALAIIVRCVEV